jgi:UDP-N-acetylmuramate--alanine ligase
MEHAHLIGIGGSGLSAIARVLFEDGYQVSGSDIEFSSYARELQDLGVNVYVGHEANQISGADFVLRSSAIPDSNVEVVAALQAGIPVYKRADFLGKLTANRNCIAVAGTHGKTTTTAMISWMLTELETDPAYIIGGVSKNLGVNAHAGGGNYFVIEADEYDRMFLGLRPYLAVVTNIEHDHPDSFPTEEEFFDAFVDFTNQVPSNGYLLVCTDDPHASDLLKIAGNEMECQLKSFGLDLTRDSMPPDYLAKNLSRNQSGSYSFDVESMNELIARIDLQVPGLHNVRNSLASLAVAEIMGLSVDSAARALCDFLGTERRFDIRGEVSGITVIDDYAHHPTEIRATLEAARQRFPHKELWAVWQPHTYTRTEKLFTQFLDAFKDADHVLVTEIFPSRETARNDFSSKQVVQSMDHVDVKFLESKAEVVDHLITEMNSGDVVIVLSAGDAYLISEQVVEKLSFNGNA